MRLIEPDENRMIDLPGVGPCQRPVDIDQRLTGFKTLKSLRIYRFRNGPAIRGDSEIDEVFILPLVGTFQIEITGRDAFQGRLSALGPDRALYMPPHHSYRLAPADNVLVAYARAGAVGTEPVHAVTGNESLGLAEHLRFRRVALRVGDRLEVGGAETLVHVIAGRLRIATGAVEAGRTLALNPTEARVLEAIADADLLIVSA